MNGGRSSWRSCRDSWVVRKVWLPVWAVLSCLLLAPSLMALAISPDRMNSLAVSVAVPHRECPLCGMTRGYAEMPGDGTEELRSCLWQDCSMEGLPRFIWHGAGGEGREAGKRKIVLPRSMPQGGNRHPLSPVNDTAEVLKRGLGSSSASCLFPVTGLASGGGTE